MSGGRAGTPVLAIGGGKGGVGGTTLAVQLARLARRQGYRTLIADLDAGLPDVDVLLRVAPRHTIEDVVAGDCRAADAVIPAPDGLALLAGARGSTVIADADRPLAERVLSAVRAAALGFDLVVCDAGSGLAPMTRAALQSAELPLCVTTPDAAASTNAWATCVRMVRDGGRVPGLVVNRAGSVGEAVEWARRVRAACRREVGHSPAFRGWVRQHAAIQRAGRTQTLVDLDTGAGDLRALAAALLSALPAACAPRLAGRPAVEDVAQIPVM